MISVRRINDYTVSITGFDPDKVGAMKARAAEIAEELQGRMAALFEEELTYKGALKANTDPYTEAKISQGYDPRRGHRTGALQEALDTETLWRVTGNKNEVRIVFEEEALYGAVDYATYYAEAKVRGNRILGVKAAWIAGIAAELNALKLVKKPRAGRESQTQTRDLARRAVQIVNRQLGTRFVI